MIVNPFCTFALTFGVLSVHLCDFHFESSQLVDFCLEFSICYNLGGVIGYQPGDFHLLYFLFCGLRTGGGFHLFRRKILHLDCVSGNETFDSSHVIIHRDIPLSQGFTELFNNNGLPDLILVFLLGYFILDICQLGIRNIGIHLFHKNFHPGFVLGFLVDFHLGVFLYEVFKHLNFIL